MTSVKFFFIGAILFFSLLSESLCQINFWRGVRRPSFPDETSDQRLFPVPYEEPSKYYFRDSQEERRDIEESRPLCEEVRKSIDVRDFIQEGAPNFIQSGSEFDFRKYHLIPRKIDIIKCVSKATEDESSAVCKPENCRERKVDLEVFGRLRNETGNFWEFIGTLSAVPVACECFVRWKPQKCSTTSDIFSRF